MKYTLLLLFILISCNKSNKKDILIDEIELNKNKKKVFLSFYPNMSSEAFELLKEKETLNNNLFKEDIGQNSNHYYKMNINNNNINFYIYKSKYGVKLYHLYRYYDSNPSKYMAESGFDKLNEMKKAILGLFESKYGNYEIKQYYICDYCSLKGDDNNFNKFYVDVSDYYYIFQNQEKVAVINFDFIQDYHFSEGISLGNNRVIVTNGNGSILVYSIIVNIRYYTPISFKEMRNKKINDSLKKVNENLLNKRNDSIKAIKKEEKLLNDI